MPCLRGDEEVNSNQQDAHMTIETEKETDGRWIAEVPDLPSVLVSCPAS